MKALLKVIFAKQESFALSLGRVVLTLVVSGLVIAMVGMLIYILAAPAGSETSRVSPPKFDDKFVTPELNPIDRLAKDERIRKARKSFQIALDDVMNQVKQTSKNLHLNRREIEARYEELAEKPENKINMRELASISERMSKEINKSCAQAELSFKQQFENIERDLGQISKKFDVKKSDISTDYNQKISGNIRNNKHCHDQSESVKRIANNLSIAYPGRWGLPPNGDLEFYTDGDRQKSRLPLAVASFLQQVEYNIPDKKQLGNYINSLDVFTQNLSEYYSGVADELEKSNRMTSMNSELLAQDITTRVKQHANSGIIEYSRYVREENLKVDTTYFDRLVSRAMATSPAFVMLAPFLLGAIFMLLFFASERHFRNIKDKSN